MTNSTPSILTRAMWVICLINTKGGVGKTVSAINLGAALAALGFKVLLFDVDLQGVLTSHFNIDPEPGLTSADILTSGIAIEKCILPLRENLFLVPATSEVERAERALTGASGGEMRLRRAFKRASLDFDYVLIDCPSGWGAVMRNAILASDAMIVPVNSEPYAITSAVSTIAETKDLAEYHDHEIELLGVLLTRFRGTRSARTVEKRSCKLWGESVFESRIRQTERVNELAFRGETSSDGKHGNASDDYAALAGEVVARSKTAEPGAK